MLSEEKGEDNTKDFLNSNFNPCRRNQWHTDIDHNWQLRSIERRRKGKSIVATGALQVHVRYLLCRHGGWINVAVDPSATVAQLKLRLERQTGHKPDCQILLHKGKKLDDTGVLSALATADKSSLMICLATQSKMYSALRFTTYHKSWWYSSSAFREDPVGGQLDCIQFSVDAPIRFAGVGLYGDNSGGVYEVYCGLVDGVMDCMTASVPVLGSVVKQFTAASGSDEASDIHDIILHNAIQLIPGSPYTIVSNIFGPKGMNSACSFVICFEDDGHILFD